METRFRERLYQDFGFAAHSLSHLEGNDTSELITKGSFIGELGLVHGTKRLTTVKCISDIGRAVQSEQGGLG